MQHICSLLSYTNIEYIRYVGVLISILLKLKLVQISVRKIVEHLFHKDL